MSKIDNKAMTTGIATVALRFNGGAVIAADRRGTVDRDTDYYDYMGDEEIAVPMKLAILGTTRAATLAGESGQVLRSIEGNTLNRLVKAEKAIEQLETVKESANYVSKHFGAVGRRPHVEMIVAGWDNVQKDGALCIWYGNHTSSHYVAVNEAIGPGQVYAQRILSRHKIGMSEKEVVKLAEEAIAEAAVGCGQGGGSLDVWVIKDGQIKKNKSQLMTNVTRKYGVSI